MVLHHGDDLPGVRLRPTGAAVAASASVILKLPERNVSVCVRVGAVWILAKADIPQQSGRMSTDFTFSGICRFAFAVELNERTYQKRVLFGGGAVIAFERRPRLGGYIGPASGQSRIHRVAEVLCAPFSVGEIRDTG